MNWALSMNASLNSLANCASLWHTTYEILRRAKRSGMNSWILTFWMSLRVEMKNQRRKSFHRWSALNLSLPNISRAERSEDGFIVRTQSKRPLLQGSSLVNMSFDCGLRDNQKRSAFRSHRPEGGIPSGGRPFLA